MVSLSEDFREGGNKVKERVESLQALQMDGKNLTWYSEQFGGSAVKVGEDEFTLFRDHEYVSLPHCIDEYPLTSPQHPGQDQRVKMKQESFDLVCFAANLPFLSSRL